MVPTMAGALVRSQRRKLGITKTELARRAGMSLRQVDNIERGGLRGPVPTDVSLRLGVVLGIDHDSVSVASSLDVLTRRECEAVDTAVSLEEEEGAHGTPQRL